MADRIKAAVSGAAPKTPTNGSTPAGASSTPVASVVSNVEPQAQTDEPIFSLADLKGISPEIDQVLGAQVSDNPSAAAPDGVAAENPEPSREDGKAEGETAAEAPAAEEEARLKSEADAKAAADAENDDPDRQQWPESAQKRVDKLTAQKKEAQEKAAATETKLQEATAELEKARGELERTARTPSLPSPDNPLADVWTSDDLNQRVSQAQQIKTWAMENLEGATVKDKDGNEQFIEPAQMRKYLAGADALLTQHAPARQAFFAKKAQLDQEAQKFYPQLFDKASPEFQQAVSAMRELPWLRNLPNALLVLGDALEGQKARFAKHKAQAGTSVPPKAAPPVAPKVPPSGGGAPPKVPVAKKDKADAQKRFVESGGNPRDLAEVLESIV